MIQGIQLKFVVTLVLVLSLFQSFGQGKERIVQTEGLQINVKTQGKGKPTVIFENGMGSSMDAWEALPDSIATFTAVFSYDRAGIGASHISHASRTVPHMVEELRAVLKKEKIAPPYVYVAHSMGSYLARYFATAYPDEIQALLLVDPSPDKLYDDYTEKEYTDFQNFGDESYAESSEGVKQEWEHYLKNRKYVQEKAVSDTIPMTIVSATQWDFYSYHSGIMNKNENSKHLQVEGSHDIHQEKPDLIRELIQELISVSK
ncbi:alpha/beta fold hydrolase [Lutimonas sp.]|uniref:alpha/beta fold hydrolase n=1 Tax=Lutimonas sp. TaxID=1872403 RepID=UPI003D9B8572